MKSLIYLAICSVFAIQSCAQKSGGFVNINSDSLNQVIQDEHIVLLDVRTPEEYAEGHIPGAINIDYLNEKFAEGLDTLNKELVYEVYCRSGGRSAKSSEIMIEKGFVNVNNLEGGITDWQSKGYQITK